MEKLNSKEIYELIIGKAKVTKEICEKFRVTTANDFKQTVIEIVEDEEKLDKLSLTLICRLLPMLEKGGV